MRTEYTLVKDIVSGHSKRMNNIKKYYPFFKVSEISFLGFKEVYYHSIYLLIADFLFFVTIYSKILYYGDTICT